MYIPAAFAETDQARLQAFIRAHSFGLLVSNAGGEPFATHLPFMLDEAAGPSGTLIGHMARTNPQWQELSYQAALAVFSGPHAYISPTWYEAEQVVPTWNYVAVHAYGTVELCHDPHTVREIVERTVAVYEAPLPQPWKFDGESTFAQRLLAQIVAFRMPIQRLEGKWKLNQNHSAERRQKVIEALLARSSEDEHAIARLMRQGLRQENQAT